VVCSTDSELSSETTNPFRDAARTY